MVRTNVSVALVCFLCITPCLNAMQQEKSPELKASAASITNMEPVKTRVYACHCAHICTCSPECKAKCLRCVEEGCWENCCEKFSKTKCAKCCGLAANCFCNNCCCCCACGRCFDCALYTCLSIGSGVVVGAMAWVIVRAFFVVT